MARAQLVTKRWSDPKHVFSFRVDELVVRVGKDKVPKFVTAVEKITYADLADILPPGRQRLLQTPNTSTAPVFKTRFVADPQPPASKLELKDADAPVLPAATWNVRCEPLDGPDTFVEEIVAHVLSELHWWLNPLWGQARLLCSEQYRQRWSSPGSGARRSVSPTREPATLGARHRQRTASWWSA